MLEPIKQLAETKLKNNEAKTEILAMVLGRYITWILQKIIKKKKKISTPSDLILLSFIGLGIPSFISGCRGTGHPGIASYCCVIGVILLQAQTIRNKNKKLSLHDINQIKIILLHKKS